MKKRYFVVQAIQDDDLGCESPREVSDTPTHLVTKHSRYNFVFGRNDGDPTADMDDVYYIDTARDRYLNWVMLAFGLEEDVAFGDYQYDCMGGFYAENDDGDPIQATPEKVEEFWKMVEEWVRTNLAILPVYLYDHSGISLSTSPFSCSWDSGQIGYIYITREEYEAYTGGSYTLQDAEAMLHSEIKELSSYLAGDVWGIVYSEVTDEDDICDCDLIRDSSFMAVYRASSEEWFAFGEPLDSYWGYIGYDYVETAIEEEAVITCAFYIVPHASEYVLRTKVMRHNGVVKEPRYLYETLTRPELITALEGVKDLSTVTFEELV